MYLYSKTRNLLYLITIILIFSCNSKNDLDKNALIIGQTISNQDIQVFKANSDYIKGDRYPFNTNIFLRVSEGGIMLEPSSWFPLMNYAYSGKIISRSMIDGIIQIDYEGHYIQSETPNSAISNINDCLICAEIDTINKTCSVTVDIADQVLIFDLKYQSSPIIE